MWHPNESNSSSHREEHYYLIEEKIRPLPPFYRRYIWQIFTSMLLVVVIVLASVLLILLRKDQKSETPMGNPTHLTTIPTQVTSITTRVPDAQTPSVPASNTVLCQANWSKGTDGWVLGTHWNVLNGVLINDGDDSYSTWLVAPCQISVKDYVVESEMKIDKGCNAHGVVARAIGSKNYAGGSYCLGSDVEIWLWGDNAHTHQDLAHRGFDVGSSWHTYRLEVRGNELRLLIDGSVMCDVNDDTIQSGAGQVGIWSQNEQLEVRSFKVIAF